MTSFCLNCCILLISDHHFEIENCKLLNLIFQRSLIGLLSSGAHHWRCSWLLQHNAAAWTPPCSAPCAFFRLPTYGWKTRTDREDRRTSNAAPFRRPPHWSLRARADVYVMKWGWLPSTSSNFSRKVRSQVSPGLRHSSFCKQQQLLPTGGKITGKHQL